MEPSKPGGDTTNTQGRLPRPGLPPLRFEHWNPYPVPVIKATKSPDQITPLRRPHPLHGGALNCSGTGANLHAKVESVSFKADPAPSGSSKAASEKHNSKYCSHPTYRNHKLRELGDCTAEGRLPQMEGCSSTLFY
jgi:hypothetical protein